MTRKVEISISEGEYALGRVAMEKYYLLKGRNDPQSFDFEEWLRDLLIGAIKAYSK